MISFALSAVERGCLYYVIINKPVRRFLALISTVLLILIFYIKLKRTFALNNKISKAESLTEELIVAQPVKIFPFHETLQFIAVATRSVHLLRS